MDRNLSFAWGFNSPIGTDEFFFQTENSIIDLTDLHLDCFQTHPETASTIAKHYKLDPKAIETLQKTDRFVLERMPIALLTFTAESKWLLQKLSAPDHEIFAISLKEFSQLTWVDRRVLIKRLECIEEKEIPKGNFHPHSIGPIRQMKTEKFFEDFPKAPTFALELLTESQREHCDFSHVSIDTLKKLSKTASFLFEKQIKEIDQIIAIHNRDATVKKPTEIQLSLAKLHAKLNRQPAPPKEECKRTKLPTISEKRLNPPPKPPKLIVVPLADNHPL